MPGFSSKLMVAASLVLLGCDKLGPMREHNTENKVHSPSSPAYQPPPDEKPLMNMHTGQPLLPGEPLQ